MRAGYLLIILYQRLYPVYLQTSFIVRCSLHHMNNGSSATASNAQSFEGSEHSSTIRMIDAV